MLKEKGNIIFLIFYLVIVIGLMSYLFFNDYGVLKYFSLKSQIETLQQDLENTTAQIDGLQTKVDSLQVSLKLIEEVARERHHMLKQNEQGYKIQRQ